MKNIPFLIIMCALNTALCGYNIGNFKHTDLVDYYLTPRLNNNTSYQNFLSSRDNFSFNNRISIDGSLNISKPKFDLLINSYEAASYNTSRNDYPHSSSYHSNRGWNEQLSSNNKIEYKSYKNDLFAGFEFTNTCEMNKNDSDQESYYSINSHNSHQRDWDFVNQIAGTFGYGRLYECQESYLSWYFFNELGKNGCLSRQFTDQDIDELALVLYQLRSIHMIDPRAIFVRKSTLLLDDLKSKDYVNSSSETKATSILMDLWLRGNNETRLTGTRFEVKPFLSFYNDKHNRRYEYVDQPDDTNIYNFYHAEGGMELVARDELPLNNIFQLSREMSVKQGWFDFFADNDEVDTIQDHKKPFTDLQATCTISCYPDCRSLIALNVSPRYQINNMEEIQTRVKKSMYNNGFVSEASRFDLNTSLGATYQISSRMDLTCKLSGTLNHVHNKDSSVYQLENLSSYINLNYRLY